MHNSHPFRDTSSSARKSAEASVVATPVKDKKGGSGKGKATNNAPTAGESAAANGTVEGEESGDPRYVSFSVRCYW